MDQDLTASEAIFTRRVIAGLTVMVLTFAGAYIWQLTFSSVPESNKRFADTALGFILGTVVAGVLSYWIGASRTSGPSPAPTPPVLPAITMKDEP